LQRCSFFGTYAVTGVGGGISGQCSCPLPSVLLGMCFPANPAQQLPAKV